MDKSNECIFSTKDYWLIIGLVSNDSKLLNIESKQDEKGQNYLLWSFEKTDKVLDIEKAYNLNQPIMIDLQKAKAASELFKRNLSYHRIR